MAGDSEFSDRMSSLTNILSDTLHIFYPSICIGCGEDGLSRQQQLCLHCLASLPHTHFAKLPGNDIEKIFTGRIPVRAAHSEFYFAKGRLVQHLIHLLKYQDMPEAGVLMGRMIGQSLLESGRFQGIDAIIPMPLYRDKEYKRGYNQAAKVGEGISEVMQVPQSTGLVNRQRPTETQTRKHRTERWENVQDSFKISDQSKLRGKHLLVVDDVITTGASIEAMASVMLECPGVVISVASIAHADK